jgi:hypothetical protein
MKLLRTIVTRYLVLAHTNYEPYFSSSPTQRELIVSGIFEALNDLLVLARVKARLNKVQIPNLLVHHLPSSAKRENAVVERLM